MRYEPIAKICNFPDCPDFFYDKLGFMGQKKITTRVCLFGYNCKNYNEKKCLVKINLEKKG